MPAQSTKEIQQAPTANLGIPPGVTESLLAELSEGSKISFIRSQQQMVIALQRPRDLDKIEAALKKMAAGAEENEFYYSIPFKNHVPGCQDRRRCHCPEKRIEGKGIGMARALKAIWTNCALEKRIESETPEYWDLSATFVDLEMNSTQTEPLRVSKLKPLRGGRWVATDGKEAEKLLMAGFAKVERNAVINGTPKHITDRAFELARASVAQSKQPVPQQIARLTARFSEEGVPVDAVERYLGCPFTEEGLTKAKKPIKDTMAHLRGLLTAIRGGDADADDIFKPADSAPEPPPEQGQPTPVTPEALAEGAKQAAAAGKPKGDLFADAEIVDDEEEEGQPEQLSHEEAAAAVDMEKAATAFKAWAKRNGMDTDGLRRWVRQNAKELGVPAEGATWKPEHYAAIQAAVERSGASAKVQALFQRLGAEERKQGKKP